MYFFVLFRYEEVSVVLGVVVEGEEVSVSVVRIVVEVVGLFYDVVRGVCSGVFNGDMRKVVSFLVVFDVMGKGFDVRGSFVGVFFMVDDFIIGEEG